jgi:hypothetical protein
MAENIWFALPLKVKALSFAAAILMAGSLIIEVMIIYVMR